MCAHYYHARTARANPIDGDVKENLPSFLSSNLPILFCHIENLGNFVVLEYR